VVGIESGTDADTATLNFFKLTKLSPPEPQTSLSFVNYDELTKYFLGIGFIVGMEQNDALNNMYGPWYIKNTQPYVKISGEPKTCTSLTTTCTPTVPERGSFDWLDETYLVKKIEWPNTIYLGVKESNFEFTSDFAYGDIDAGIGAEKLIGNDYYAAMTRYDNRIWISYIDLSNANTEYKTLIQAAVASSVMDWYMNEPDSRNTVEVSRFSGLCCDIPETAEISFVLWYVF